jgi:replicative DNA helicase
VAIERLRFDEQPERLPPHNIEAEEAILGSVLLDREVIGRVSGALEARDFYRERNGTIYQAMLDLYERHEPVDYLTLIDELDRTQKIDQVGGVSYLTGLLGVVPTPIHAENYARIVADNAFMRRLISAGGKIATIGFQNQFDTETALEKSEQILFDVSSKRANRDFAPLSDILREYLEQLSLQDQGEGIKYGVPSGFVDLDKITAGGFQRSDLIILAARPSMGKTSLALGMAANAGLKFGAASAIFSLEMSGAQLAARLLATESGIETTRLRTGNLTEAESRKLGHALGMLAETQIYIDDTPGISVTSLRAKTRRLHAEVPLDLVIVDHLQLMTAGSSSGGVNRVQEMSEISRQLKGLARELHVPVIALSQLSRAVEQRSPKIPILSDLRESGAIEQDADLVMFIYRDDYYNKDSEKQGIAEIHIAKHRNGPTGQVSLLFNQRTTKFLDLEVYHE